MTLGDFAMTDKAISYAEICRDQAKVIRDSYSLPDVPFDPTDPDYDAAAREMFTLADAFDALAVHLDRIKPLLARDNPGAWHFGSIEILQSIAAGFQPNQTTVGEDR